MKAADPLAKFHLCLQPRVAAPRGGPNSQETACRARHTGVAERTSTERLLWAFTGDYRRPLHRRRLAGNWKDDVPGSIVYAAAVLGLKVLYVTEANAGAQAAAAAFSKFCASRPRGEVEYPFLRLLHSTAEAA